MVEAGLPEPGLLGFSPQWPQAASAQRPQNPAVVIRVNSNPCHRFESPALCCWQEPGPRENSWEGEGWAVGLKGRLAGNRLFWGPAALRPAGHQFAMVCFLVTLVDK